MSLRRGACPALDVPMTTGDGMVARLSLISPLSIGAFERLCEAAAKYGNGVVEVSARGSLQFRGLTPKSAGSFAAAAGELGVEGSSGTQIVTDPLGWRAGEALVDPEALGAALRDAVLERGLASRLAPKVSVTIDGGGALHLDALAADIRMRAVSVAGNSRVMIAVGGNGAAAVSLGAVAVDRSVEAAIRLLTILSKYGRKARGRDFVESGSIDVLRAAVRDLGSEEIVCSLRTTPETLSAHALRSGLMARGIGLLFGYANVDSLLQLMELARAAGSELLRPAPGRVLLFLDMERDASERFATSAERIGFVVAPNDPRRHVIACPGAPACGFGEMPARAIAPDVARAAASMFDGTVTVHLSGCDKGCAHPAPASLTITGRGGRCGLVVDGTAWDPIVHQIMPNSLLDCFAALAKTVSQADTHGQSAADALKQLGDRGIVAAFREGLGR